MAKRLETGGELPRADAVAIVEFVTLYADGLHHAKEEQVLFPALEEEGMPRAGGPIAVMLMEHERGREYVAGMRSALGALADRNGKAAFAHAASGFADLLEHHIAKENMVLFAMADRMLPQSRDTQLLSAYADREASARTACGDKATHEASLNELSRRWL